MPSHNEWRCPGISGLAEALVRGVLLICDEIPVVYVYMIVHPRSVVLDWSFLKALGVQSLGHSLFADPHTQRGDSEFALLDARHPLVRRTRDALGNTSVADMARLPTR